MKWEDVVMALGMAFLIVYAIFVLLAIFTGTPLCPEGKTFTPIAGGKAGFACLP